MIASAQRALFPPQAAVWTLLLANGFLIALMLALAKAATSQGMPAVTYAFWQTLIAGAVLLLCSQKRRSLLERRLSRYFLISGLTGIAVPNVIGFYLVTKLGAGFTGIMYALPPIFTFLIATGMGLEKRSWIKLAGLSIAVIACTWIVLQRHSEISSPNLLWFAMGLIIPAMLSIGNVYRSVAWPDAVKPMILASGTLLASALTLGLFAGLTGTPIFPESTGFYLLGIVVLQGLLTALTYLCAFELQRRSNPVFYSQLGAVAAVFGLLIGVVWFREDYSVSIWLGAFMVILGLRISNRTTAQTATT
ncbi:DMT family transporter [Marinobacter sp. BW6]|uniref:DMT family transporter n=1 Tax=Marinobacter sp. BW6 TaxID=2592624 RepID=UPI0011DE9690|nr:DMT family transporter [Marinobacter sp. BW6]TYC57726.1 DMT family transporter [Marinobacter sp. BW6]